MFEREKEFVAPKAKTPAERVIVVGMTVFIVALVAFLVTKVPWIAGICAFLVVVPVYLNFRFKKEYAYAFVGDKLTVRVADFKGNKTDIGKPVFMEDLVVCAKEDDDRYNEALKATYQNLIDARTSPSSKTAVFAVFDRNGEKSLVRFEPVDMMIDEIKKFAADKVFVK